MSIFLYISAFIFGLYACIILRFSFGWFHIKPFHVNNNPKSISVSIIVACRNEEDNIAQLLNCLVQQNYSKEHLEIIVVDDHSEDSSVNVIERFTASYEYIKHFKLPEDKQGKKEALDLAIKQAAYDHILTTDADCTIPANWVSSFVAFYTNYKSKLIAGPVVIKHHNLFHRLQTLEFMSLVGSGAGAFGIKRPIMNNGANLFFEKSLYNASNQQKHLASGDDIFLLLHAKRKYKNSIHFLKSTDAVVYTNPANNLNQFINQRVRWTSKSKSYKDFDLIITALVVLLTNLILGVSIVYNLFASNAFFYAILFLALKSIIDMTIILPVARFFHQQKLLWFFIPLQVIYPFYIILTAIFGLLGNFRWKNRSLQ